MAYADPEDKRAWYRRNRESIIARSRNWKRRHPAEHRDQIRAYRENHPEKYAAHKAVKRAIECGDLIAMPCELDNDDCQGIIEAHHDNYSKPLDVRWLCKEHHRRVHYD